MLVKGHMHDIQVSTQYFIFLKFIFYKIFIDLFQFQIFTI